MVDFFELVDASVEKRKGDGAVSVQPVSNVMEKIINGVFTFYAFPVPWGFVFNLLLYYTSLKYQSKLVRMSMLKGRILSLGLV